MSILKLNLSDRNILVFYLILMNVHFVYFEGAPISWLKSAFMILSIPIFFMRAGYISKAVIIAVCFWLSMFLSAMFHPETFRFSTLGFSGMHLMTFIMFYNLLYKGELTLEFFIRLVRYLIIVLVLCHIAQQLCLLVGIKFMPIINLSNQHFLAINKLPSLTLEPSVFARVLGVLMYAYLKGQEYAQGQVLSIKQMTNREHIWIFIGFLWSMFTMGSGTAFIVIGLLLLYFLKRQYIKFVIPLFLSIWLIGPYLHIKQLDRAISVVEATSTLDGDLVNETDGSAATRVKPLLNTFHDLDLTTMEGWFGRGQVSSVQLFVSKTGKIGNIDSYGFLSYLIGLLLVFVCCIQFWSLGTILYFAGIAGNTGNIAYCWGLLIIFTCVSYFRKTESYE